MKKLARIPSEGYGIGVCAGIAYHLEVPVFLVRILFVFFALFVPPSSLIYLLMWAKLSKAKAPRDYKEVTSW